jgi:glycosyltransferase involved in cell wall biosynthesis
VNSVLTQTFNDFELLMLDDGSTDRSLEILRDFEAKDDRVRLLRRENRGLVPTLNELIDTARGTYLARMDGDDICRAHRFERQVKYLEARPDCVAVGSQYLIMDTSGMPITGSSNELTHDEIDSAHLSGVCESRICHPSVMLRRDAVVQIGKYRGMYAEDMDLFLRLAEIGKLSNLSEVLLDYRQHLASISYTRGDQQRKANLEAVKTAWRRRGINISSATLAAATKHASQSVTKADAHRNWAWWALMAGNVATARKHSVLALAQNPLCLENLKAFACAIRGY